MNASRSSGEPQPEAVSRPTDVPFCDCQVISSDTDDVEQLALYVAAGHLRTRLGVALSSYDLLDGTADDAFLVPTRHLDRLRAALNTFSASEWPQLLAVPIRGGMLRVGQVVPLSDWIERLSTPWFAPACEHLCFHYQPIVTLTDGQVYGYEALVRAQLDGKLIGAGPLLAAAAAHQQFRSFDAQARQGAIRQGYPKLRADELLFINFAPGVVYNPDICLQTTFRACREVDADFSRLVFEVTESESFPDLKLLQRILERYRAEGAQVALDDLGAGHTSLIYLTQLRPDIVKLDRSLIMDLSESDPRFPLVLALIRYAQDLGIRVVAEGIETANELTLIRQIGADYAQGYYLGRPAVQPVLNAELNSFWDRPYAR